MSVDWFRSWHGAPTDPKWLSIARKADVIPAIVVSVAWALMDRASQAEDRGSIAGFDADAIAAFNGCEEEDVLRIVSAMVEKGVIDDNRLVSWEKRQPKREDSSSDRVRKHRQKNASKRDETQCNAPDKDTDTEVKEEPNGSSKKPLAKRASRIPDDFVPDRSFATGKGLSDVQSEREAEKFVAYWQSSGGKNASKLDWHKAWTVWVNNALDRLPQRTSDPPHPSMNRRDQQVAATLGMSSQDYDNAFTNLQPQRSIRPDSRDMADDQPRRIEGYGIRH